jgi:hypothetical protein
MKCVGDSKSFPSPIAIQKADSVTPGPINPAAEYITLEGVYATIASSDGSPWQFDQNKRNFA